MHSESLKLFRQRNIFVVVETPWREAEQHVAVAGNVPVICSDAHAERFETWHLSVAIDAPQIPSRENENKRFVILLDDLPLFCKMWFYSDLNYAGDLNRYLRLTLTIRDPFRHEWDDTVIPKELQRRFFEPFGCVKGLMEFVVEGQHYPSLERQVREQMAVPYDSPSKCLQEAIKLQELGDQALNRSYPRRAIELYIQSFEKIHIICVGRRRSIWGEVWFDVQFTDGPFKDQHGQVVWLTLRVTLVANIIKAYLDLEDYAEAEFWGMRSIRLMRESAGFNSDEEAEQAMLNSNFPGSMQMGRIYYRTGVAQKALGMVSEARQLLKIAAVYLPDDEAVTRELASIS